MSPTLAIRPQGLDLELSGRLVQFHSGEETSLGIALVPLDLEHHSRFVTFVERGK